MNINKVLKRKEEINRIYKNKINKINGLEILTPPKNCKPNNWLNVLIVNEKLYGLSKNQVIQKFYDQNIETRSLWYPNHLQKPFKKFQNYEIKKSNLMFKSCLCLPSSYGLQKSDQSKIIKLFKNKFN